MDRRVILIVLDSVGIGALPDAADFGDVGTHTLGNIFKRRGHLDLPNLTRLGLANIEDSRLPAIDPKNVIAGYGRAIEQSRGKDTTSGHWEIAGLILEHALKTYPNGFPAELIRIFEEKIGRGTLGNVVASGTEIIKVLGDEHVRTGKPIVYTSADSVFQIAAHESVIELEEQYRICGIARELLVGENSVGRVIARPFTGESGAYVRTPNRKDFSLPPTGTTILDGLVVQGYDTVGIGKIEDIFARRGIMKSDHTRNNCEGVDATLRFMRQKSAHLIFVNLVDYDMLYGHRNDVEGYAAALEAFDARLPELLDAMEPTDLLIITADHGCDPTTASTDHSREYIPVLSYAKSMKHGVALGTRNTFADIGCTVYQCICGKSWPVGNSFLAQLQI